MRIDPSETIGGFPILEVRRVLRLCGGFGFHTARVAMLLRVSEEEARPLVEALAAAGYVTGENDEWESTMAGNAFAMASAGKPLRRKSCDRIVREFLDRVAAANQQPFVVLVNRVYLFGSYARGGERPTDIDVYVEFKHRYEDHETRRRAFEERARIAEEAGRVFTTYWQRSGWPWQEIGRYIRGRARALSITTADEWVTEDPDAILVYRHPDLRVDPPYAVGDTAASGTSAK